MCGSRRYRDYEYMSERREDPDLRVSDEDRESVAVMLRKNASDGRLSVDELSERLDRVYAARTVGDLQPLTSDLPAERTRARGTARRGIPTTFVWVSVLLIAIWAATGAGYFWPLWPMLWFAFATMKSRAYHSRRRRPTYI
jgi:hypothetical protein